MLFKILVIICVLYMMFIPFLTVWLIKIGMKFNQDDSKNVKHTQHNKIKKKDVELPLKVRQALAIMSNIDTFDGTSYGQKEIPNE